MVIDENDALQVFNGIDSMPEDMRPRAASLLADYKAQQEALGAPLWPTQDKLKQGRNKRVQEVFQNPLVLDTDNGAFVEANKVKPGLGDNLRAREANILWLADRYNADEADVRKRYDFYKADASQKWGSGTLDDPTLFNKAKAEIDADMVRMDKRKQATLTGIESALFGASMASELGRFLEAYPNATDDERLTFANTLAQTTGVFAPHKKLIDSAAPAMRRIQKGEATDADLQTIEDLTWTLAQSKGSDREILMRSLLMGAKKVAEEGGRRNITGTFAGSAVNLIENMYGAGRRGENVARNIDPSQPLPIGEPITSVQDALKAMDIMARAEIASRVPYDPNAPELPSARVLSDEEKAFVIEAKDRAKSLFKTERELKKIALSTDPMDESTLGIMARGSASSLSLMLPLMMGPQGLLMAGGGYANMEREELLTEFPDMNPDDASKIAVLSGAAQAAMDKATLFGLDKFAPNVRKMLINGATKELVKKAALQGTALFAFENTIEAAQDLSTATIQQLVSELSTSVPQVDWQKEKEEFLGTRLDVAIGMVPLMLIGAGVNTAANKQQINKMLSNNDLLMRVGIIQEDRVKILELSTAGKTAEAQTALEDAMDRRSPELAAEVADRYASKIDALRNIQEESASLQDATSPEYTASVTRTPTGWQVTTGEGTVIPVESAEAARRIAVDLRQVGSQQEADALVSVIDGYYEKGRQAETVLTGEKVEASEEFGVVAIRRDAGGAIISQRQLGPQALETVRAEAEVAGIKTGTRGVFAHINGSNEVFPMRVADGAKEIVRRMNLYKSQAEGQPQVMTFLHENFESTWRLGIENGTFSDQETRTAMRALLPAFEGVTALNAEEAQFIDNLRTLANGQGNETMLRETVSEMVMRDVLGRDRQGLATGMKPGSISSAIEASVMGANTQEEASALKSILAAIKAFTAYLKGVFGTVDAITKARDEGKLGEEYDTFINKVLGIDEVKQMEQAAVEEGKAMLGIDEEVQAVIDAGNMAFSMSRAQPADTSNVIEMPDGAQLVGPTTFSITAYHGTPHKVDRFRMAKIGTGEGAQAYGWGLYFAKSRMVAKQYQASVTSKQPGNTASLMWGIYGSGENFWIENGDLDRRGPFKTRSEAEAALLEVMGEKGNLYTVELLPDEEDFLDWDKPLSEQSEKVKAALAGIGESPADIQQAIDLLTPRTALEGRQSGLAQKQIDELKVRLSNVNLSSGAQFYKRLGKAKVASEMLAKAGIPGIRYLDGSSRAAGEGTSNYVIFDESLVKILEENGQKVDAGNMAFSISPVTPEQDAAYLALAKEPEKNRTLLQNMVDESAGGGQIIKNASTFDFKTGVRYVVNAFHGSKSQTPITVFDKSKLGSNTFAESAKKGFFFAGSKETASSKDYYIRREFEASEIGEEWVRDYNKAIKSLIREAVELTSAKEVNDLPFGSGEFVSEWGDVSIDTLLDGSISDDPEYIMSSRMEFLRDELAPALEALGVDAKADIGALSASLPDSYLDTSEGQMVNAYLFLNNPMVFDDNGNEYREQSYADRIDEALENGHDSVIIKNTFDGGPLDAIFVVFDPYQIKSADPVTYDDAGNVIPLSERFNEASPDIRFSISPIRNLNELSDQVERNFAENPAGALEVKSKVIRQFAKLADKWSNERWTPQGNKIRPISEKRTVKSLDKEQAMRQATLEGEKIAANMEASQALKEAKAEAQAWRDETDAMQKEDWSPRESLVRDLITLEAIVAMFPQEIRGKIGGFVTLARKASEAARLKVLQRQLERGQELLEKHLKEQYGTAVDKLLERYQSKRDSSGRISGKILSTATEQVDYAAEFIDLDIASQAKEQAALEKQVEESESAEEVQDALTKLGIARLFEVWSTKDSASRESAFLWLNETIEQGKQGKKLLDEERKAFLDDMRQSGKSSILQGDELNPAIADNLTNLNKGVMRRALLGMRGVFSESLWTTLQRLELIFGEDSKILDYFEGKIINAANLSTDIKRLVESQKKDALTVIFNSDSKFQHARGIAELQKLKDSGIMISKVTKKEIKLDIDTLTKLADGTMDAKTAGFEQSEVDAALEEFAANARKRTVTIEKVTSRAAPTSRTMSETQGIQWWLWSMQEASRKQMERDGWDADSFAQLEEFLSPEAKALGRWISGSYQDAAGMIDPIYRRLFNAPLPRIKNYSPIHRRNMNAGGEVMDLDSSDMNSGLAAGFVSARVNTTASLVESDALAVFLAHWENVSHWVAHAELMRDMKAILLDKDTAVAIRQKKSEGYLQRLKQDISTIEKNGTNSANELVNMSRFWRWLMQYRAYKGLAFRISPIIKQTPALLNPLLADVPAHNYMMGLSRAFIEPQAFASEVSAMWKSDIIRRRIESGFSAESRVAMQGSSMTGSQAILAMQTGMMPMSAVDGGWTALGAAISFDYYRRGYMRENPQMTPEMADNAAIARVEKMIATSAQPSDVYARALYERSGNPFMRSMSMFVSDQRKALAIELMAIRRLATGKSKNKTMDVQRALVAHVVQAGVSQVMAGVIASLLGDDEDRDREWSTEQWTLALTLGPINGLFVLGRLVDKIGRGLLGLRVFPADDLASKAANDLLRGGKNMDELFSPDNPEEFMDALDSLSTAAAAGMSAAIGPAAGAADVGANVIREARKIQERLSE